MAGTTTEKLESALSSKEKVRTAIVAKGVACGTDVPFSEYGNKILSISAGGDIHGPVGPGGSIVGAEVDIAGVGAYTQETRQEEIIE